MVILLWLMLRGISDCISKLGRMLSVYTLGLETKFTAWIVLRMEIGFWLHVRIIWFCCLLFLRVIRAGLWIVWSMRIGECLWDWCWRLRICLSIRWRMLDLLLLGLMIVRMGRRMRLLLLLGNSVLFGICRVLLRGERSIVFANFRMILKIFSLDLIRIMLCLLLWKILLGIRLLRRKREKVRNDFRLLLSLLLSLLLLFCF